MINSIEETAVSMEKAPSKTLTYVGLFFLVYLVICIGMYFYLKQNYDNELTMLRSKADSIRLVIANQAVDDSLTQLSISDTIMTDTEAVSVITDTVIVKSLVSVVDSVEKTDSALVEDYNKQLNQLVKIVDRMKPIDAANILARLDDEFVIQVLMRMRERNAAKVMSEMPPVRAARLSRMIMDEVDG